LIGIDIVDVSRIEALKRRHGIHFLRRVFTDWEIMYAERKKRSSETLAGRFAAKEAVFKALGDPKLNWKDVEILNDKEGKPCCVILSPQGKKIDVHISISHVKNYAVANAIVTQKA
jgi:holo-[acyl-carrier protein] synthase